MNWTDEENAEYERTKKLTRNQLVAECRRLRLALHEWEKMYDQEAEDMIGENDEDDYLPVPSWVNDE